MKDIYRESGERREMAKYVYIYVCDGIDGPKAKLEIKELAKHGKHNKNKFGRATAERKGQLQRERVLCFTVTRRIWSMCSSFSFSVFVSRVAVCVVCTSPHETASQFCDSCRCHGVTASHGITAFLIQNNTRASKSKPLQVE